MPLSEPARAVVEAIRAASPPVETLGAEGARKASDARRAAQVRVLEDVAAVEDTLVDGIPVRIYRPSTATTLPVTVFAHGGGWVIGGLDSHDPMCRIIANRAQTVVVAVDYRRAPEARFPAALDDVLSVLSWVAAHAAGLNVDPDRIAVAGDSAGGNLAAAVALRARDAGGPALAAQLLLYPVVDSTMDTASYHEFGDGFGLDATSMRWYWEQYVPDGADRKHPLASLAHAESLAGLPPAVVAVADHDPLRDEGLAYAARLAEAGVPTWSRTYADSFHGFLSLPGQMLEVVDVALTETCEQLKTLLRR